ncbi:hypothetical protein WAI453_013302 [Rhynchosporium graminicola]
MDAMDYTMDDAGNHANNNPAAIHQCLQASPSSAQHGYSSQGHFDPVHDASNYYYGINPSTSSRPSYQIPQNQHTQNWGVSPYMPGANWQGFGDMSRPNSTHGGPDSFLNHRGPGRNYEDTSWSGYRQIGRPDDTYGPFANQLSGHNLSADHSMRPGGGVQAGSVTQTSTLGPSPLTQNFDRPPTDPLGQSGGPSHTRAPSLGAGRINRHQTPSHSFPTPPSLNSLRFQRAPRPFLSRPGLHGSTAADRVSWGDSDEESVSDIENEAIRREEASYREDEEEQALLMDRASAAGRRIMAKEAFNSLEKIKVEDLPKESKDCTICYNDFGLENPDGVIEQPVRWPKCKHLFGDKCIQRWFKEGKDTCPYCREKIPSESATKNLGMETQLRTLQRRRLLQAAAGGQQQLRHDGLTTGIPPEDPVSERTPLSPQFSSSHEEYDVMVNHNAGSWTYSSQHRYSPGDSPERRRQGRGRPTGGRSGHHMGRLVPIGPARSVNQSFGLYHNPLPRGFGPPLPTLHTPATARRTTPPGSTNNQGNLRQGHTHPHTPQARPSAGLPSSASASPEEASPPVAVGSGLPARHRFGVDNPAFRDPQNSESTGPRQHQRFWDEARALEQQINALSQNTRSVGQNLALVRRLSESGSRVSLEASQTFANP